MHSKEMGVTGECDVVEFHKCEDGISLHGHRGLYSIYPIEYKKGRPKHTEEDVLQLTAQAICLEEMFSTEIQEGALFMEKPGGVRSSRSHRNFGLKYRICFGDASVLSKRLYAKIKVQ